MKSVRRRLIKLALIAFALPLLLVACGGASYASFAQCLGDQGATFYGAFWCPFCQEQKALFGGGVDSLPYVECSTPDGQYTTLVCQQQEITNYPTWEFADGSRQTGVLSLEMLASATECELVADQ